MSTNCNDVILATSFAGTLVEFLDRMKALALAGSGFVWLGMVGVATAPGWVAAWRVDSSTGWSSWRSSITGTWSKAAVMAGRTTWKIKEQRNRQIRP